MKFNIEANYLGKDVSVEIEADSFNEAFDMASQIPKFTSIREATGKPNYANGGTDGQPTVKEDLSAELRDLIKQHFSKRMGNDFIVEVLSVPKQKGYNLVSEDIAADLQAKQKILMQSLQLLPNSAPSFANMSKTLSILSVAIGELKHLRNDNHANFPTEHI